METTINIKEEDINWDKGKPYLILGLPKQFQLKGFGIGGIIRLRFKRR